LFGVWVAALAPGACSNGSPPARGFASFQTIQTRDPTLVFVGFRTGQVVYATTDPDGGTQTLMDLDVEALALQHLGAPPTTTTSTDPPPRYSCSDFLSDSGFTFYVTDLQTGVLTIIDRIAAFDERCPTEADPSVTAWRHEADGHVSLWTGRYDAIQPVSLPLVVDLLLTWSNTRAVVAAERPDAPGGVGIFGVDYATGAVTEIVPATLAAAAWAEGATPAGALTSSSVRLPDRSLDDAMGIGLLGADRILYTRVMADGGNTVFVSPIVPSPAGELALFRVDAGANLGQVALLTSGSFGAFKSSVPSSSAAWQYISGSADVLLFWDAGTGRLVTCPGVDLDRPIGDSLSGGRQFLIGVQSPPSGDLVAGALLLVSPDGDGRDGSCTLLAPKDANEFVISPDGALAWLVEVPEGAALWTAAANGSGAREIGRGAIAPPPYEPYFFAPSRLELRLDSDLVWIDVRDDPVKMHYIAEQVFGSSRDYDRQVLSGYELNGQDGTGNLALVDRDTDDKRLISREVATFQATSPSTMDSPVSSYVAYLVRGRNPSSQDGLWIATINKADLE
jgi:hypothetical protein